MSRYEDELRSEQSYVTELYARLDAERARAMQRYRTALRGDGEPLADRDAEVRAVAKEVKRLDVADYPRAKFLAPSVVTGKWANE